MIVTILLILGFCFLLTNALELWLFGYQLLPKSKALLVTPKVSIMIPACNEEKHIFSAISSMEKMDYPNKEIIIVNDRSTDKTPQLIDELAKQSSIIKIIHIEHLPSHWMGKNHALYEGTKHTSGEWILFTDSDVYFDPDLLSRAMHFCLNKNLDHFAIFPKVEKSTFWMNSMMLLVTMMYFFMAKPWRAKHHWSQCSVGQGSFNLVKKSVYFDCGGHEKIRLNSDDDVKLGALIKSKKYKQDICFAENALRVPWYSSLPEMIKGLEKNIFAYMNYNISIMIFFTVFTFILFYLPLFNLFFASGIELVLCVINTMLIIMIFILIAKRFGYPLCYSFLYPITLAVDYYMSWRSLYYILKNQGVSWRDTFYSLENIKEDYLKTKF